MYHYAGNNPVKYTDPDGRTGIDVIGDIIFKDATISRIDYEFYYNGKQADIFRFRMFTLSDDALNYLKNISNERACTYGAISIRNICKDNKLTPFDEAVSLQSSSAISYYKDENGKPIIDPEKLYDCLQLGDILLYKPDMNYFYQIGCNGITEENIGYSGHTATVIGKGKDDNGKFVDILEFHMQEKNKPWNKATVKRIYSKTLRTFNDCELVGGAQWN